MNTEEAKLILGATHSGVPHEADADADLGQALALLEENSDLKNWLQAERAFDDVIAGKLAQIEPPADLKASLLALVGDGHGGGRPVSGNPSWFRPQLLAAAAAIILIPVFALQLLTTRASAKSFENFRVDMVNVAKLPIALDHKDSELPKLLAWLDAENATCPTDLPTCVACADSVGCKIIDWGNETVTLICLKNKSDEVVHCFIIRREEFDALPDESLIRKPLMLGDLETSGWSDKENVYLLVGSAPGVHVKAPQ